MRIPNVPKFQLNFGLNYTAPIIRLRGREWSRRM